MVFNKQGETQRRRIVVEQYDSGCPARVLFDFHNIVLEEEELQ